MNATWPSDPIEAVTHDDPYPYYADLATRAPFAYDTSLRCWVAAGANAVTAVLASPDCRVRPPDERVPPQIAGTPAGDVFGRFARMNDGARHERLRAAATSRLQRIEPERAGLVARRVAGTLTPRARALAEELPALVLAELLGIAHAARRAVPLWTASLVRSAAPGATAADAAEGAHAAGALVAALRERGEADDDTIANEAGFLFQAYDATAGLIGNALRTLGTGRAPSTLLDDVLSNVMRDDPPVQNTRRFVARETAIAGATLAAGDMILVVLAAAQRDPRKGAEREFGFGAAAHRCPGDALAFAIARAGIERLLDAGVDPAALGPVRYRPSANVRVPQFEELP